MAPGIVPRIYDGFMSVDALGVPHGYQARRKGLGAPETRSSSPLRVGHTDDEITAR